MIPRLNDLNKVINLRKGKLLKVTHFPITIKEIKAGYLNIPYFKNIHLYLAQNKLLSSKAAMQQVETQAENIYYVIR